MKITIAILAIALVATSMARVSAEKKYQRCINLVTMQSKHLLAVAGMERCLSTDCCSGSTCYIMKSSPFTTLFKDCSETMTTLDAELRSAVAIGYYKGNDDCATHVENVIVSHQEHLANNMFSATAPLFGEIFHTFIKECVIATPSE